MLCKKKRNLLFHNSKELNQNYIIKCIQNVLSITRCTSYEYRLIVCLHNDNNPVLLGNMAQKFIKLPSYPYYHGTSWGGAAGGGDKGREGGSQKEPDRLTSRAGGLDPTARLAPSAGRQQWHPVVSNVLAIMSVFPEPF